MQGRDRSLGIGSSDSSTFPVNPNFQLPVGETITKFLRGSADNIVLTSSGRVYAWGRNFLGIYAVSEY